MSSRVTRSNARNSAGSSNSNANSNPPPPPPDRDLPPPPTSTRKRKANAGGSSPEQAADSPSSGLRPRPKRSRVDAPDATLLEPPTPKGRKGKAVAAMSDQDADLTGGPSEEPSTSNTNPATTPSNKRKSSRKRHGQGETFDEAEDTHTADAQPAPIPSPAYDQGLHSPSDARSDALLDDLIESAPQGTSSERSKILPGRMAANFLKGEEQSSDETSDSNVGGTSQSAGRRAKKSSCPDQNNPGKKSRDKSGSRLGKTDGLSEPQGDGGFLSNRFGFRKKSDSYDADSEGGSSDDDSRPKRHIEDDDEDPFEHGYLSRHGGSSLSNSLRALSGFMSGQSSRLRNILERLKEKDLSEQLIALQDFSELLLISTEDNLAGHFSPDAYIKELITLMKPSEFGEENPEIMLLACRCIANMMEALPSSTANVVYCGAVPVLCEKLLEIHYIDVAEQALITLEKISVEFPSMIVENGGLAACLQYLDFFATSNQRTAVTTAANCCRNLSENHFYTVKEVMPVLLGVLGNSDQKVLEQGCLCVSRIVESYKFNGEKLEELVGEELLKAILRLLLPGTTNLISANIHTQFLRVLAFTARASPRRAVELFKMSVVDTLYQILTGVSPPTGADDAVAAKIDKVIIMQALIHRPRDQIFETLNVICELLPDVQDDGLLYADYLFDAGYPGLDFMPMLPAKKSTNSKRVKLLDDCKDELKRFTIILLPTLTDVFSSTVNLSVRQKVLTAQLKMLSNIDVGILGEAVRNVSYASFLASILSQQDHPTLVTFALQAAELLIKRMESIYRYQFYREGVISEIAKLADRSLKQAEDDDGDKSMSIDRSESPEVHGILDHDGDIDIDHEEDEDDHDQDDEHEDEDDDGRDDDDENEDHREDTTTSGSQSPPGRRFPPPTGLSIPDPQDIITKRAKKFIELHEPSSNPKVRVQADSIMKDLKRLTEDIEQCFMSNQQKNGLALFRRLASHFDQDALESITSYELLTSNVVGVLLETLGDANPYAADARTSFLEAFMGQGTQTKEKSSISNSPATPFSVLVHKLQDLLSRAEHFEVITVHQNSFDSSRSSAASMLAKQIRLRLTADDDSGLPRTFRNIQVSIHAIATFKALDEYLRQKITLMEGPHRGHRSQMEMLSALMAGRRAARGSSRSPLLPPGALPPPPRDLTNRIPKRGDRAKATTSTTSAQPSSSATPSGPPSLRRSSRRNQPQSPGLAPPVPALGPQDEPEDPIECADEAHLSDDDEASESGAVGAALNAVLDELDNGSPSDDEDPQAVNMEVASTGKVTARKDDGTRIATPLGSQAPPSRSASASQLTSNRAPPSVSTPVGGRALSYASALQAAPQDWHLEFSFNGQPIPSDMTVYRFIHFNQNQSSEVSARNIWSGVHTVHFKRASGPQKESTTLSPSPEASSNDDFDVPASIARNPTTASILQLLSLLHSLNSNIDDLLSEKKESIKLVPEPTSQFVNTKLTAKLNRQLEEPLIVASNCLPSWSEDLARLYPFLFPFETRHLFLQSTSFGYSRSMSRWQNAQSSDSSRHDRHRDAHHFLGRLQRQKVRISRTDILKSAIKVMDLYGSSPSILEVEYFEEVGTGLGPTLEFYSTVSKEFAKKKLKMWRENESSDASDYAFSTRGLFPAPMSPEQASSENGKKLLSMFKSLGKFVARSMLDSRIIDVSFNPTFFRVSGKPGTFTPSLAAVRSVDNDLANSLKMLKKFTKTKQDIDENPRLTPMQKVQKITRITVDNASIEDLALDFTLPGYPKIELIPGGSDIAVNIDNVAEYIDLVVDFTLGSGVARQVEEFHAGFSSVFPYTALQAFTPSELVMLFGRNEEDWSLETLMDSIKADHGFNLDSRSVRNLLQVMSELSLQHRRDFLQFVTGSPKLPIGGAYFPITPFQRRTGMLTLYYRLQSAHTNVHRRLQAERGAIHLRRLSPVRHDLRQLPQAARLQHNRSDEGEDGRCDQGRPGGFPPFLECLSFSLSWSCARIWG